MEVTTRRLRGRIPERQAVFDHGPRHEVLRLVPCDSEAEGVNSVRRPPRSPDLNPHLERFFGETTRGSKITSSSRATTSIRSLARSNARKTSGGILRYYFRSAALPVTVGETAIPNVPLHAELSSTRAHARAIADRRVLWAENFSWNCRQDQIFEELFGRSSFLAARHKVVQDVVNHCDYHATLLYLFGLEPQQVLHSRERNRQAD